MAKKRSKKLPKPNRTEREHFLLLGAIIMSFLTRVFIVKQTGLRGSAYFWVAYDLLLFLLIVPMGIAEAVRDTVTIRFRRGEYRRGKQLFNTGLIFVILYILVCVGIWISSTEWISANYLLGRYNILTLALMAGIFVADALTLVIRGYLCSFDDRLSLNLWLLLRQIAAFFLVLIFSGVFRRNGEYVSALLESEEVRFAYGSAGVTVGLIAAAVLGFFIHMLQSGHSTAGLRIQILQDSDRYGENTGMLIFTGGIQAAIVMGAIHIIEMVVLGSYGNTMRAGDTVLWSYQWGIYAGVCKTMVMLPILLVIMIPVRAFQQMRDAIEQNEVQELRFKCQGLLQLSSTVIFFFATFIFIFAGRIVRGLFGITSMMAVRMLRIYAIVFIFAGFAIVTVMLLFAMNGVFRILVGSVISLLLSGLLYHFVIAGLIKGIYGIAVFEACYFLFLTISNILMIAMGVGLHFGLLEQLVWPLISALLGGLVPLLLQFLLGLFMPDTLIVELLFIVEFLATFYCAAWTKCISARMLDQVGLARYYKRLGRKMRILR